MDGENGKGRALSRPYVAVFGTFKELKHLVEPCDPGRNWSKMILFK